MDSICPFIICVVYRSLEGLGALLTLIKTLTSKSTLFHVDKVSNAVSKGETFHHLDFLGLLKLTKETDRLLKLLFVLLNFTFKFVRYFYFSFQYW